MIVARAEVRAIPDDPRFDVPAASDPDRPVAFSAFSDTVARGR